MKRLMLMLFAAPSLTGCASKTPIVSTPPAACADLVPAEWRDGVPAAAIPDNAPVTLGVPLTGALVGAIVTPWVVAYLTTDSALEKANQRTRRTIEIVTQCEALANAARP